MSNCLEFSYDNVQALKSVVADRPSTVSFYVTTLEDGSIAIVSNCSQYEHNDLFIYCEDLNIKEENFDVVGSYIEEKGSVVLEAIFGELSEGSGHGNDKFRYKAITDGSKSSKFMSIKSLEIDDSMYETYESTLGRALTFLDKRDYLINLKEVFDRGDIEDIRNNKSSRTAVSHMRHNGKPTLDDVRFVWKVNKRNFKLTLKGTLLDVLCDLNGGDMPDIFVPSFRLGEADDVYSLTLIVRLFNIEKCILCCSMDIPKQDQQYWYCTKSLMFSANYEQYIIGDSMVCIPRHHLDTKAKDELFGLKLPQIIRILNQNNLCAESTFWDNYEERVGTFLDTIEETINYLVDVYQDQNSPRALDIIKKIRVYIFKYGQELGKVETETNIIDRLSDAYDALNELLEPAKKYERY